MKKYLVILLTLVLVFSFTVGAMAAPAEKERATSLEASAETVEVGQPITFTVTTEKHGSNYANPAWYIDGVLIVEDLDLEVPETVTVYADDFYVSTKTMSFATAGTYEVSVEIVMSAGKGKSQVQFVATETITIEVTDPTAQPELLRYEIRDWTKGSEIWNSNETNHTGWYANGKLWAVYDNGEVLVNGNFDFQLTRLNDNLQAPGEIDGITVYLID